MVHNHNVWKDVAAQLDNMYPAEECHDKCTYLKRRYREVLRNNNSSGRGRQTFMYFEEMDSVLGHCPISGVVNHAHLDSSSLASTAVTEDSSSDLEDNEVPDEDDIVSQNSPQAGKSMFLFEILCTHINPDGKL
ncbi:uncharacterized protein [Asterias amurensis]|uniref:uncharacterized protein isoform X2 n=1 Tax=Asterias amurensis TaxID=7602 RepID=UPI003AB1414D